MTFLSISFLTYQVVVPTTQVAVGITKDDAGKALGIVSGLHKAI